MGTKIIYTKNKIIFDGHCDTKEECENITLLCNNLANSKDYKTIKYENGYAEFEKVGKSSKLRFVKSGMDIVFDSHITKVTWTSKSGSVVRSITSSDNIYEYTMAGTCVVELENGYILDSEAIAEHNNNAEYITNVTSTSFEINDSVTNYPFVSIALYSKVSSTTSTTKLIKIKFKDTLTFTSDQIFDITFKSNNQNFTQFLGQYGKGFTLSYNSTAVYDFINGWTTPFNIIEIDPTQANFNAFITAMKDNIQGVELEAGTYKWVDEPSIPTISFEAPFTFITTGSYDYIKISVDTSHIVYTDFDSDTTNAYTFSNKEWWNNTYKTITTTENQYVDYDFYNYAILGNQLVKQESTTATIESGTYVFNINLDTPNAFTQNLSFTSDGVTYSLIKYITSDPLNEGLYFGNTRVYEAGGWNIVSNRTIQVPNNQEVSADFKTWFDSNTTKQTTPTYKFKHWKKSNVVVNRTLVGEKYYYFKPYTILGLYRIDTTLTNCTGASANATKIQENGGLTLTFTANSGYELPTGVSVTNVTSYNWNKATGVLAISKPTGDVSIEIVAVSALPQLTTPTNVAVTDTTLTFDEVANATSYEVFVDNVSIGTHSTVTGYTISWSGGGKTPSIRVSINDGELIKLAESTGSINNVKTIKFFAEFNEFMVATVKSTTLNLNLSGDGKPSSITAGSIASSEYTLTQDVTDLVISTAPRSTII